MTICEDEVIDKKTLKHTSLIFTELWALANEIMLNIMQNLKGCVRYIFASLFFKSKKRALVRLGKMFFILLQKLFSFSRKSNFRILDIQIS